MEATPREGEAAKGGERDIDPALNKTKQNKRRLQSLILGNCLTESLSAGELARYPFRRETSGWCCPCGSLATNNQQIITFSSEINIILKQKILRCFKFLGFPSVCPDPGLNGQ